MALYSTQEFNKNDHIVAETIQKIIIKKMSWCKILFHLFVDFMPMVHFQVDEF